MPVFDCTYTCQERWPHILPYIDKYSVISWGIRFYAFSSVLKTDLTDCLLLKPNHLKSKTIKWSQIPLLKHTVCFPVQQVLLSFHVSCHSCHVHLFWPCLHPCTVIGLFPPCLCFSTYIYTAIMKSCQCCFALLSLVCSSVFSRSSYMYCISRFWPSLLFSFKIMDISCLYLPAFYLSLMDCVNDFLDNPQ